MRGELAQHRVRQILLTYETFPPSGHPETFAGHDQMSGELRDFARRYDLPLVNLRDRFVELLADGSPRSKLFLSEQDGHPNARGYREVAAMVAASLEVQSRVDGS
jgi:lysophospholipase L1-like esterase